MGQSSTMTAMGSNVAAGPATRVLIVDDEEYQRAGLASMVSSWGFAAETAGDGQEALDKLSSPGARPGDGPDDAAHGRLRVVEAAGIAGRHAARHRPHGLRKHRNRHSDDARSRRVLVPGKADSTQRAALVAGAGGLAKPAGRRNRTPAAATELSGRAGGHGGRFARRCSRCSRSSGRWRPARRRC